MPFTLLECPGYDKEIAVARAAEVPSERMGPQRQSLADHQSAVMVPSDRARS
jgi:hypothetical protein